MKLKYFFKNLLNLTKLTSSHHQEIKRADKDKIPEDYISNIANKMHCGPLKGVVKSINKETNNAVRIKFYIKDAYIFKAGTYLNLEMKINNITYVRPYSIVSSPLELFKTHQLEIIVKEYMDSEISKYLNHELKVGDIVNLEIGLGHLYYHEGRDTNHLVIFASSIGITPFISIAKDIKERSLPIKIDILYLNETKEAIIAKKDLDELESNNIHISYFFNQKYDPNMISSFIDDKATYFVAGSKNHYEDVVSNLSSFHVDLRELRRDYIPYKNNEPSSNCYHIEVHQGLKVTHIKGLDNDSIAVSLEKNNLYIHTSCRAGSCGCCRIKILKGDYYIPHGYDYRRIVDKEYHYVHACSTYPRSDLIIKINIDNRKY